MQTVWALQRRKGLGHTSHQTKAKSLRLSSIFKRVCSGDLMSRIRRESSGVNIHGGRSQITNVDVLAANVCRLTDVDGGNSLQGAIS